MEQDESGKYYVFESNFTLPSINEEENEDYRPIFMISKEQVKNSGGGMIKSQDFMLVADSSFKLEKAYSIQIVHPIHKEDCIAWKGFVNMSKPQMQMQGKNLFHAFCFFFVDLHALKLK